MSAASAPRSWFQPHVRKHGILEDASPDGVHEPKGVLRAGEALLGSQPVPAHRFGVVLEFRRDGKGIFRRPKPWD